MPLIFNEGSERELMEDDSMDFVSANQIQNVQQQNTSGHQYGVRYVNQPTVHIGEPEYAPPGAITGRDLYTYTDLKYVNTTYYDLNNMVYHRPGNSKYNLPQKLPVFQGGIAAIQPEYNLPYNNEYERYQADPEYGEAVCELMERRKSLVMMIYKARTYLALDKAMEEYVKLLDDEEDLYNELMEYENQKDEPQPQPELKKTFELDLSNHRPTTTPHYTVYQGMNKFPEEEQPIHTLENKTPPLQNVNTTDAPNTLGTRDAASTLDPSYLEPKPTYVKPKRKSKANANNTCGAYETPPIRTYTEPVKENTRFDIGKFVENTVPECYSDRVISNILETGRLNDVSYTSLSRRPHSKVYMCTIGYNQVTPLYTIAPDGFCAPVYENPDLKSMINDIKTVTDGYGVLCIVTVNHIYVKKDKDAVNTLLNYYKGETVSAAFGNSIMPNIEELDRFVRDPDRHYINGSFQKQYFGMNINHIKLIPLSALRNNKAIWNRECGVTVTRAPLPSNILHPSNNKFKYENIFFTEEENVRNIIEIEVVDNTIFNSEEERYIAVGSKVFPIKAIKNLGMRDGVKVTRYSNSQVLDTLEYDNKEFKVYYTQKEAELDTIGKETSNNLELRKIELQETKMTTEESKLEDDRIKEKYKMELEAVKLKHERDKLDRDIELARIKHRADTSKGWLDTVTKVVGLITAVVGFFSLVANLVFI